jgi:hypothetical protein
MTAEDYREKAEYFLSLAQQMSDPHDRAKLVAIAALWMERAVKADQHERSPGRSKRRKANKGSTPIIGWN